MSNNCNIPPNNSGLESCFKIFNKINTHKRIEWRFNNRTGCKYPGITIHRLAAPESITGYPVSNQQINLCWSHNKMATHYELTHFEVGDESRKKQKTITTKTYEAVSGLGTDKLYGFFVVAKHNSIKDSDKSKTIEIKTFGCDQSGKLHAPQHFGVTSYSPSHVSLRWDHVNCSVGYGINFGIYNKNNKTIEGNQMVLILKMIQIQAIHL